MQASRTGFDWVEIQFLSDDQIEELQAACRREEIGILQINTPHGVGDEVGLAVLPGRQADFHDSVSVGLSQARRLEARQVNILAGRPDDDADPQTCLNVYLDNIRLAADAFAEIGIKVMIEPVNWVDRPGFFLSGLDFAFDVLHRADHPDIAICLSKSTSKFLSIFVYLAMKRVARLIAASSHQACDEATVRSQSLASLRHRPSHARVRSTTHRLAITTKPATPFGRLMISIVGLGSRLRTAQ